MAERAGSKTFVDRVPCVGKHTPPDYALEFRIGRFGAELQFVEGGHPVGKVERIPREQALRELAQLRGQD